MSPMPSSRLLSVSLMAFSCAAASAALPAQNAPPDRPAVTEFERVVGGPAYDRGVHVTATRNGGYAVVGVTESSGAGRADVYLVRFDAAGKVLWSETYGGEDVDNGWSVLETDDGFALAGFTKSSGNGGFDFYLIRTDDRGGVVWEKTYGGEGDERCWALAPAAGGGFLLAGETNSSGAGERDWLVIETDAAGEQLWSKTYGGARDDRCFAVAAGPDGGYVLAGQTYSEGAGDRDAQVISIDADGEELWSKTFGGEGSDVGHSVCRTSSGDYLVTGYTASFDADHEDPYLIRVRADGSTVWTRVLPVPRKCRVITGAQATDGGFFCVGFSVPPGGRRGQALLLRASAGGELEWRRNFFAGARGESLGYTVCTTADGGCVFTGHAVRDGNPELFLVKVAGGKR